LRTAQRAIPGLTWGVGGRSYKARISQEKRGKPWGATSQYLGGDLESLFSHFHTVHDSQHEEDVVLGGRLSGV